MSGRDVVSMYHISFYQCMLKAYVWQSFGRVNESTDDGLELTHSDERDVDQLLETSLSDQVKKIIIDELLPTLTDMLK